MLPKTHFIGFDHVLSTMESLANSTACKYPPHNVIDDGDGESTIELAVAGFSKEDISISLKHNIITISGSRPDGVDDRKYVHRGISNRSFERKFALAENVTVEGADMENGLLIIKLKSFEDNPTQIPIGKIFES
jgi:molecular chaperone IbpA